MPPPRDATRIAQSRVTISVRCINVVGLTGEIPNGKALLVACDRASDEGGLAIGVLLIISRGPETKARNEGALSSSPLSRVPSSVIQIAVSFLPCH